MIKLGLLFLSIFCSTLLISSVIDAYVRHKIEPQIKMSMPGKNRPLIKKWDQFYVCYTLVIIVGVVLMLITGSAFLYHYTEYVFSLTL